MQSVKTERMMRMKEKRRDEMVEPHMKVYYSRVRHGGMYTEGNTFKLK